jgi:DNA polymerase III sliding clamp (beta) subunit (PCNA family)
MDLILDRKQLLSALDILYANRRIGYKVEALVTPIKVLLYSKHRHLNEQNYENIKISYKDFKCSPTRLFYFIVTPNVQDFLRNCQEDEVFVNISSNSVHYKAGHNILVTTNINLINNKPFYKWKRLQKISGYDNCKIFIDAVKKALTYVSKDAETVKEYSLGVNFRYVGKQLKIIASDGHSLFQKKINIPENPRRHFTVHADDLKPFLLTKGIRQIIISNDDNGLVNFCFGGKFHSADFVFKTTEPFPIVDRILDDKAFSKVEVSKKDMFQALKLINNFTDMEDNSEMAINTHENEFVVFRTTPCQTAFDILSIVEEDTRRDIKAFSSLLVNSRKLTKIVSSISTKTFHLSLEPKEPLRFFTEDESYVLMPLKDEEDRHDYEEEEDSEDYHFI